jgi:hypothetical protein
LKENAGAARKQDDSSRKDEEQNQGCMTGWGGTAGRPGEGYVQADQEECGDR